MINKCAATQVHTRCGETEIHKSEGINKLTVDDVCPDYYGVGFEKGRGCR